LRETFFSLLIIIVIILQHLSIIYCHGFLFCFVLYCLLFSYFILFKPRVALGVKP